MVYKFCFYILMVLLFSPGEMLAQPVPADSGSYKMIAAGPQYVRPASFQHWWGKNRRTEWTTVVRVPVIHLDTTFGGLIAYKTGGGNETRSLKLKSATGKEYALRSINKSRKDVIPPYFENTFVANIIKDGVSMSYPYGAFAIARMQEEAGIPHTIPILVYVPQQSALDTFNKKFGNDLYMLEQKAEGNWSESDNLGNFSSFDGTDEVVKNILLDHHYMADQSKFVRARLFDMLIGDWDRHEDNWSWGKKKTGNEVVYIPVPKDRDQAFYTRDGVLLNMIIPASGLGFMQNFDYSLRHMEVLNTEERDIDRFFTNEMGKGDWIKEAKALQESLSDEVIEQSIQQLPNEIFAVSGNELIDKLKSRLKELPAAATSYYSFLAKQVDVVGTEQRELFEVKKVGDNDIVVTITRLSENGKRDDSPYFKRIFHPGETRQIRLYGLGGGDIFEVDKISNRIKLVIIGSKEQDSIQNAANKTRFYDENNKYFQSKSNRMRLNSDTETIRYRYDWFDYNSKGFQPVVSYNYEDRFYAGIHYQLKLFKWGREPFATKQDIGLNYSFSQRAISANYDGLFPNVIGKWNVVLHGNYDAVQWTNFFGLGNDSKKESGEIEYFRMHIRNWSARGGVSTSFGRNSFEATAFYQNVSIRKDSAIFVSKIFESTKSNGFEPNQYAGLNLVYKYAFVNDSIVTTKGITLLGNGIYARNMTQNDFLQRYDARVQSYIPLSKKFSIMIRAGGSSVVGPKELLDNAVPFQHAVIGGPDNLRGYQFDRFWGRTSFYNNNEIRFITDLKSYILNAKIGLIGFFDDGRVWMPGESSQALHTSYGGGLLFSPFHFLSCTLTYGISPESKLFQFKINTLF